MTSQPTRLPAHHAIVAACIVVLATLGWSGTVSAHTDFEASFPADGATVDGPLSTVTVDFTNPAVISGDGFQLLEPNGAVRAPDLVDASDGTSFVATFEPPLEDGTYGFRWDVQAGDAHPIQGSFQFTVVASATKPLHTTADSIPAGAATPPTTIALEHSAMSMDEFLADDAPSPNVGRAARALSMSSSVFAAGVIAALAWVIRGRRSEIERLLGWVRLAGLGLITGGFIAMAALDEIQSAPLSETMTTRPGVAALMTMAGGLFVFVGFRASAGSVVGPARSLSAAAAFVMPTDRPPEPRGSLGNPGRSTQYSRFRWVPDSAAGLGLAGIALAIGAYWFDGHTISRGPWLVHAAVNLVHVAAASVWVGGVFAITLSTWMRKRQQADTDLADMVIRFSSIAMISLSALSAAGVVMAWMVLDSFGDLFSSSWGQVLLVKIGAVAIAAGLGGYNHFVLRPALESRPEDPAVAAHLRRSLLTESAVMAAVIVITAVLVASST